MDTNNDLDECPICLESIDSCNIRKTNYICCQHKIHHKCFVNSVISNGKCPICRSVVNIPNIYFINFDRSIKNT